MTASAGEARRGVASRRPNRLPRQMSRRLAPALLAVVLLAVVPSLAACGADDDEIDVKEGEPILSDDVSYNVVISRFMNPDDVEDASYLAGAPDPPPGEQYFGVFMQVINDSDDTIQLPDEMSVVDTLDNTYEPVENDSSYALPLGDEVPPGDQVPIPDSTPLYGPIEGSLVLFQIEQASTENRPLKLEMPLPSGETGVIELDI
jgi:hypothetical protein